MDNRTIARHLREVAELLEARGANPYRVRAYRRGASTVWESDRAMAEVYAEGGLAALEALPGIGESLAEAIEELLETGGLEQLAALRAEAAEAEGDGEVPF